MNNKLKLNRRHYIATPVRASEAVNGYTEWDLLETRKVIGDNGKRVNCNVWYNEFEDMYCLTFGNKNSHYPENDPESYETEMEDYDEIMEVLDTYERA